jgi:hypothetical protein
VSASATAVTAAFAFAVFPEPAVLSATTMMPVLRLLALPVTATTTVRLTLRLCLLLAGAVFGRNIGRRRRCTLRATPRVSFRS